MTEVREQRGRGLRAEPGQSGKPVGGVTDQREPIGDRLGRDAELVADAVGVEQNVAAPVELHDLAADALAEVLVGCADDHLLDALVGGRDRGRARERVVGLVLDHRPHRDAERGQRVLEQRELRP